MRARRVAVAAAPVRRSVAASDWTPAATAAANIRALDLVFWLIAPRFPVRRRRGAPASLEL
jgi:hypothetical protein